MPEENQDLLIGKLEGLVIGTNEKVSKLFEYTEKMIDFQHKMDTKQQLCRQEKTQMVEELEINQVDIIKRLEKLEGVPEEIRGKVRAFLVKHMEKLFYIILGLLIAYLKARFGG